MAVTDGPLQSLPLSILVTEQPKGAVLNYEDYREVSWLAKSYALSASARIILPPNFCDPPPPQPIR
jgi:hypothetical protein